MSLTIFPDGHHHGIKTQAVRQVGQLGELEEGCELYDIDCVTERYPAELVKKTVGVAFEGTEIIWIDTGCKDFYYLPSCDREAMMSYLRDVLDDKYCY